MTLPLKVDITGKGGKVSKLLIGDDTPTNSGSYAMLEGDPRVFTVASYVKTSLDKTFNDLRDKRLLTFDQDKLSRVELIAKKQDIEFGRDKDQWQIVKPKPLRADGSQVDELIRKLKRRQDGSLALRRGRQESCVRLRFRHPGRHREGDRSFRHPAD